MEKSTNRKAYIALPMKSYYLVSRKQDNKEGEK